VTYSLSKKTDVRIDDGRNCDSDPSAVSNDVEVRVRLMDGAFPIPGLPVRFGIDSLLGLIPGAGDIASSFVAIVLLYRAHKRGVPSVTFARMTANIAIDACVGAVPFFGDIADIFWKSNLRNAFTSSTARRVAR
jgi:hypothetical protein